jgi:F-box protein 21
LALLFASLGYSEGLLLDMADWPRRASLTALPDEVLLHILTYIPPRDTVLNVQQVSKRFDRLGGEPLLWRYYCRVEFQYWDSKHQIRHKFSGNAGDTDWEKLYRHRTKVDSRTTKILNSILENQVDRITKFRSIGEFGYDAKDTLLRHCHTSENAEDVLARR